MEGNSCLVSVIIAAYNAEKHIDRALNSVLKQTYKNLEIIVIEDGSEDSTGAIVDKCAQDDDRLKVYHVTNGGEAKSRNLGLMHATGEYIAFCDADDFMHPTFIEKMISAAKNNDADIAVCRWNNVDEKGNLLPWRTSKLKKKNMHCDEVQKEFFTTGNIEGFCWNKIFAKKLYDEMKVRYDIRRLSFCDILANYRLLCSSNVVTCISEPLYDYYQLNTSCIHTVNIKKNYDYLETVEELLELANLQGVVNEALIYSTIRYNKQLFDMYCQADNYDRAEYLKYYMYAYEKFRSVSLAKRLFWAWKYPIQNPFKFSVKILIVRKNYRRYLRESLQIKGLCETDRSEKRKRK